MVNEETRGARVVRLDRAHHGLWRRRGGEGHRENNEGCLRCSHFVASLEAHVTHVSHDVWQGDGVAREVFQDIRPMLSPSHLVSPGVETAGFGRQVINCANGKGKGGHLPDGSGTVAPETYFRRVTLAWWISGSGSGNQATIGSYYPDHAIQLGFVGVPPALGFVEFLVFDAYKLGHFSRFQIGLSHLSSVRPEHHE